MSQFAPLRNRILLLGVAFAVGCFGQPRDEKDDTFCGDKNCYEILGVDPTLNRTLIKERYKNLSLQYHPDKNKDNETALELMKEVNLAWEIVGTPSNRDRYDTHLKQRSALNSPRENAIVVFTLLGGLLVFIVHQYQKQQYSAARMKILENPRIRRRLCDMTNVPFSKTGATKRTDKKGKKKKNQPQSSDGEKKDPLGEVVTTEQINSALKEVGIRVPEWPGEEPTWASAISSIGGFPKQFGSFLFFHARWLVMYTILGQDKSLEDLEYMCRVNNGIGEKEWSEMKDQEKRNFYRRDDQWKPLLNPVAAPSATRANGPQTMTEVMKKKAEVARQKHQAREAKEKERQERKKNSKTSTEES